MEILGILIEQYENEHFPIDLPDPIEAANLEWSNLDIPDDLAKIVDLSVGLLSYYA